MIVCKFELWPGGDAERAEPLGLLLVANDGQVENGDPDQFMYNLQFQEPRSAKVWRGRVKHWRRRGWRVLVRRAVEEMLK